MVTFAILTVFAVAVLCALNTSFEALTVLFSAARLVAFTSFGYNIKCLLISLQDLLDSFVSILIIYQFSVLIFKLSISATIIPTFLAFTQGSTHRIVFEAGAILLKAFIVGTSAPLTLEATLFHVLEEVFLVQTFFNHFYCLFLDFFLLFFDLSKLLLR